jgi:hypothetical protein
VRTFRKRIPLPSELPATVFAKARVQSGTPEAFAVTRLQPFESEMLSACYRGIVKECRALGAVPVCVFLPVPMDLPLDQARTATLLRLAGEAGFVVIDLSEVFGDHHPDELTLKDHGRHINAAGNAMITRALFERLVSDPQINLIEKRQGKPSQALSQQFPAALQ